MYKKWRSLFFVFAGTLVLAACGKESQEKTNMEIVEEQPETMETEHDADSEEMEELEDTSDSAADVPAVYEAILSKYAEALRGQWNGGELMEHDLDYMIADCYGADPFETIGYLVSDIDGDGIQELMIGTTSAVTDDFYGKLVFELYTIDDAGNPIRVFQSSERDRYYYVGDAQFANVGSSSAAESLDLTEEFHHGVLIDLNTQTASSAYCQLELKKLNTLKMDVSDGISVITLPILDEIDEHTKVGTAGAYMTAVQSAVKLLDWGTGTGLDPQEIREATIDWLSDKGNDEQVSFAEKLEEVDDAYQELLGDDAEELLESAGCGDAAYPWSDGPVDSIEAIMDAVGLR